MNYFYSLSVKKMKKITTTYIYKSLLFNDDYGTYDAVRDCQKLTKKQLKTLIKKLQSDKGTYREQFTEETLKYIIWRL